MAAKDGDKKVKVSDEIQFCEDCLIPFPDVSEYIDHLKSKDHRKGVMKKIHGEDYLKALAKLDAMKANGNCKTSFEVLSAPEEKDNGPENETSGDEFGLREPSFTCFVCNKICTGRLNYDLHIHGKLHKTTLQNEKLLREMREQNLIPEYNNGPKGDSLYDLVFPESSNSPNLECKVCKKKGLGVKPYKQHCESATHKKKVLFEKELKAHGISPSKEQNGDGADFSCDVCNKKFSGFVPYKQHMDSPIHTKQDTRMKELVKIQDLVVTNEEDARLQCKECNKVFSGPYPFKDHLKSAGHSKMKKKIKLMAELEQNFPEFVKILPSSDDSDEESNIRAGCKVCKLIFSGPESASDHFRSARHQKTLKEKEMFKKLKEQKQANKLNGSVNGAEEEKISDSFDSSDLEEEFDIIQDS